MNSRQRYIRHMTFQTVDRPPFVLLFDAWPETTDRWHKEGLARDKDIRSDLIDRFGLDNEDRQLLPINAGLCPAFEVVVLEEDENSQVIRNEKGMICRVLRDHTATPMFLEFPVKTREDWQQLKAERLNPKSPERYPENWDTVISQWSHPEKCVRIGGRQCGVFGTARELLGDVPLLYLLHDDPTLLHEIMEYLTDFWLTLYEPVAQKIPVDVFHLWEDMAFKTGPLISPASFTEFMEPCYHKIRDFCTRHEIPLLSVDSDGAMQLLTPLMLKAGVNEIYPFEVQAGNDVNVYRREYPKLAMWGGFNKRALAAGRSAIETELDRLVPLAWKGGYVINTDHHIPPDVPYSDFLFFMEKLGQKMHAF